MRNLNLVPLSGLRVIEAVGRLGSLSRAAAEMGVTPGALSQRLRKAEEALGRPLFLRHPEGLVAGPALLEVLPQLTRHLAGLDAAAGLLREGGANGLTLSVAPLFASRWLIWRLHDFTEANPGIALRLDPSMEIGDLEAEGIDAAIRVAEHPGDGVEAVKLLDQRVFPVCSMAQAAALKQPRDLLDLPVIRETEALHGWADWLAAAGLEGAALRPGPTYRDGALCLDAAATGQGVFMAWETLAGDAVRLGTVAAPFALRARTRLSYWFVTTPASARKPAVRRFGAWLAEAVARSRADWRADWDERPG